MSDFNTGFSEETLLAFADGMLESDEAAAVEAALAQDGSLRDTVRRLRLGSLGVAHAFDRTLNEPVPERLLAAARETGLVAAGHSSGRRLTTWALGLAAGLAAFAVGLGTSHLLYPPASHGYSPASEAPLDPLTARFEVTLLDALDKGAEGQMFTYASQNAGEGVIRLGRSFSTASGSQCREFRRQETRGGSQVSDDGIACRGANRAWSMMVLPGSN